MNGIEKITARLTRDAQVEIDALNAETDAQCAAILAEAEAKAAEAYEKRMEKGRADCAARSERMAATADMEQRKAALAFKQEMVGEAFEKATEAIVNLPEEEYIAFLAALAAEAAITGEEEMVLSAADKARLGSAVVKAANALLKQKKGRGTVTLAEETADIPGGFILRSGNIEVNCAVDTLVQMHRASLSSQVAEILFK